VQQQQDRRRGPQPRPTGVAVGRGDERAALLAIPAQQRDVLLRRLGNGRAVVLSDTTRPGEHKARLLLEVLRDREDDVLRFVDDLRVPKIRGRLTSEARTRNRYTILGYVSTAAKHGIDNITALRDALTG
jgi:transposase